METPGAVCGWPVAEPCGELNAKCWTKGCARICAGLNDSGSLLVPLCQMFYRRVIMFWCTTWYSFLSRGKREREKDQKMARNEMGSVQCPTELEGFISNWKTVTQNKYLTVYFLLLQIPRGHRSLTGTLQSSRKSNIRPHTCPWHPPSSVFGHLFCAYRHAALHEAWLPDTGFLYHYYKCFPFCPYWNY